MKRKEISKEEYDYAVFIVKRFHRQMDMLINTAPSGRSYRINTRATADTLMPDKIRIPIKTRTRDAIREIHEFELDSVKTGDFLLSLKTNSKHITKGGTYEVISGYKGVLKIVDNSGLVKLISRENKFRLWSLVS